MGGVGCVCGGSSFLSGEGAPVGGISFDWGRGSKKLWDGGVWKQTSDLQVVSGFDNYHKIAIHGHVCVPKFWHM